MISKNGNGVINMTNFIEQLETKAKKKQITVYETDDFSIFKLNPYNREIKEQKVNKFMSQGVKDVVFLVNKQGEILDGQHRIEACKRLKQSVTFQIIDDAEADYIHEINTVGSAWVFTDFLEHFAKRGFKQYIFLQNFFKKYPCKLLSKKVIALLLRGVRVTSADSKNVSVCNTSSVSIFKQGKYIVKINPLWVINTISFLNEAEEQLAFYQIRKQTTQLFIKNLVNFCIVLQAWAYDMNIKNVIESFKRNFYVELTNNGLTKRIKKEDFNFIKVYEDIYNKQKTLRFNYEEYSKTYTKKNLNNEYMSSFSMKTE